jgi:hypothetical protein
LGLQLLDTIPENPNTAGVSNQRCVLSLHQLMLLKKYLQNPANPLT